jgi:predicted Holliday junction resolvase-like endonuclease
MAKADIEKQFNTISYEHKELNEKFNSLYRQIESRASSLKEEWVINEKITIEKIYDDKATNELNKWKTENEKRIRDDAIKRSGEVLKGKITEHFVPYFPDFPYNPKDARFLGTPVDLIVFNGLSNDKVQEVVFIEIKTGIKAILTDRERSLKQCIDSRVVKYKIIHMCNDK